jgi:glycosyltransferase involved in cell wall biosynthesis
MIKTSVIICAHNPREASLRRTLEALGRQSLSKEEWELLVIDNASKEPLAPRFDLSWHPNARHMVENEVGLSPAWLRGMREARSDLLIFVDDDLMKRSRSSAIGPNWGPGARGILFQNTNRSRPTTCASGFPIWRCASPRLPTGRTYRLVSRPSPGVPACASDPA